MISDLFKDKRIFITGGTGSFGHTIVTELLKFSVESITIYSRDEEKQLDMERMFPDPRLNFVIGDVRDYDRVREAIKPDTDIIFHAAALKIIPACEKHPSEAIKTNLIGTINVRDVCIQKNVSKAIFISTDKAVKPVNTYGMTKALAEKVWISNLNGLSTIFSVVRYGNVISSRGSVIPYFKDLISQNKPLPITDQRMSRFFLTLKQAINLVFNATLMMTGGEVFVPKIPASNIINLVVALAGKEYKCEIVGVRPGEKISEVLISEEEAWRTEDKGNYFVIHPYGECKFHHINEYTSETTFQLTVDEIRELLEE